MAAPFAVDEFKQLEASWLSGSTDPRDAGGIPDGLGSVYLRKGNYPTIPTELYVKLGGAATGKGWARQNLVNLRIFNIVTDFGAVGDGVTDCRLQIIAAINAANAAGGGAVYIPPAVLGYAVGVNPSGSQPGAIDMNNIHNVTIFGDGFNSWLKMAGDYLGRTQYLFYVHNGCTRIGFFNFRCNGESIVNPNVGDQNHYIQPEGAIADVTTTSDVDVCQMWFDPIRGAALRVLGEPVLNGRTVSDIRFSYNSVNIGDGAANGRSCVEANRNCSRVMIHHNWLGPVSPTQAGQNIDFEPAGFTAPDQWSIIGNIIVSGNVLSVTLSGVDANPPHSPLRNLFAYNLITGTKGGTVEAVAQPTLFSMHGNVVTVSGNPAAVRGGIVQMRNLTKAEITENVLVSLETVPGGTNSVAFWVFNDAPSNPSQLVIADNLISSIALTADPSVKFDTCNQIIFANNMIMVDLAGLAPSGIVFRPVSVPGEDWIIRGNMIIPTTGTFVDGLMIACLGTNFIHNVLANHNLIGPSVNGLLWDSTGFAFLDWRSCNGNLLRGATSQAIALPATLVGVTMEGTAGQNAQVALSGAAPSGNISASPGSFCMNTAGGVGNTLSIKETGTGTGGWVGDGPDEIQFGVTTANATITDQYIAPGFALPTETAVEIKVAMPRPGNLRNMRLHCTAGVGGGSNTFTVRRNGVDTSLALTLLNTASSGTGSAATPAFAAGDLLSIRTSKTLAPGTPQTNIVVTLEITS